MGSEQGGLHGRKSEIFAPHCCIQEIGRVECSQMLWCLISREFYTHPVSESLAQNNLLFGVDLYF